jgi:hypothetical protein
MSSPRMNLFKGVARNEKSRARLVAPKGFRPQFAATLGAVFLVLGMVWKSHLGHKARVEAIRAQIAEADAQIQQVLAMSEQIANQRKPAAAAATSKPSGIDGTWTAVLWKFAAFTGERVVIRDLQLTPLAGGGKIQSVTLNGAAASLVEVRRWLERLIENMPGSEFSIQSQKVTEDPDYPVAFSMQAQVI